jgi:hypothetical protein
MKFLQQQEARRAYPVNREVSEISVMNEAAKITNTIDGFTGYEDRIEGDDQQQVGGRVIQGALVKFTNEAKWTINDGTVLPPSLELVVVDINRVVQKWIDHQPVETIELEPRQKFPDIEKLNEKAPKNEWSELNGKPQGPWQAQHIVYLLDMATMDRFSWPTGTVGGNIAIRDLVNKVKCKRKLHRSFSQACPIVKLSDIFMRTRFGGRQRPHFLIVGYQSRRRRQ